jgi:uncharacterized protein
MKIYAKLVLLLTLVLSLFLAACGDAPTSTPRPIVRADATATAATGANPLPAMTTAATGATPTSKPLAPLPTDAVPPTPGTSRTQAPTVAPASGQTTPGQTTLTTAPANIRKADGKMVDLTVELAQTPQEQQTGLMGRTKMADGEGMLFIFAQPGTGGFWMKNTLLPLSIAFIDEKGVIVDIRDMQPLSEETVAPTTPYIWALEVPQGYFTRQGVKIGDTFTIKR